MDITNTSPRKGRGNNPQNNESGEFPDRLRQIIGDRSVRSFARHCGISDSVMRQYLNGKSEPTRPVLLAIACCTGVAVEWLATGTGPMKVDRNPATVQLADGDFVSLPHVVPLKDEKEAALSTNRLPNKLLFRADWLKKDISPDISRLAKATANGNAMAPTIGDGDALLVDLSQNRIDKDGIYLLQANGVLVPRRIQVMLDGGIRITCDNAAYAPQTISPADTSSLSIIGRVVWVGKKLP